ncbi:hypothetical protein GJ744_011029 [Endocarpon pusillum]|uniref:PHD-type domain-containing protein n=1 Tax=Endocarpon pusillum TaxID=364733 RepID=A0A8H7AKY3_9EURO|nr:hypothetical protein GJ744_011029 [Endocarpon pusillum]
MNRDRSRKSRRQPKARPLTPAKTPTSDAYELASPSSLTFESSFHDPRVTWDTANPCSSSPQAFTTPKSEVDGDTTDHKSDLTTNIDAELASHIHHLSPTPYLTLPPVEPSRQLSSSPGPGSSKRTCLEASEVEERPETVQTRTKHPVSSTSTSNTERVERNTKLGSARPMADPRNRRLSAANVSRMGPPETPGRRVAASPQLFPSLQFSPDLFQAPMSGPAPAPSLPQNRLFWDPSSNPEDPSYHDPFGPPHSDLVGPFTPSPVTSHGFQSTNSVSSAHQYDLPSSSQNTQILAASLSPSIDDSGYPAPFTASPRVPAPAPDDPSMFLSSPARRFGPAAQPLGTYSSGNRPELQAYHHQAQESRREEELRRTKKTMAKKPTVTRGSKNVSNRPTSPPPSSRPGTKRSSTHSGIGDNYPRHRHQSQVSFADSFSVVDDSNRHPRGGRSSPLEQSSMNAHENLDRPQSRSRTSLSFTIDKDGRAKTVVTRVSDRPQCRMDMDEEPSGSDTDSVDAADFDIARSQNNSFAFYEQEEQHRPVDRLRREPNSHSKSSSYSSTIGSSASAPLSSRTSSTFGGARSHSKMPGDPYSKGVLNAQARRSFTSVHARAHNDTNTIPDEEVEERFDAQHALRAMLKDRTRSISTNMAQLPLPQLNTFQGFHSSPPVPNNNYGIFNASPTTITDPDLATPSTDRGSHASSGSTRCICNSSSPDGHLMIQCESCSKWLHATCVGIESQQQVPLVYVCNYCRQTPMRGGRIREPSRAAAMAPASPLAGKKGKLGR